jgi:hypothetical protein
MIRRVLRVTALKELLGGVVEPPEALEGKSLGVLHGAPDEA